MYFVRSLSLVTLAAVLACSAAPEDDDATPEMTAVFLRNRAIATVHDIDTFRADPLVRVSPDRSHAIVQLTRHDRGDLSALEDAGVHIAGAIGADSYVVSIDDSTTLDGLGVFWAGRVLPEDKLATNLNMPNGGGVPERTIVEFYTDVAPADARAVLRGAGFEVEEHPGLPRNQLVALGSRPAELARWDEVAFVLPAPAGLTAGSPMHVCAGPHIGAAPVLYLAGSPPIHGIVAPGTPAGGDEVGYKLEDPPGGEPETTTVGNGWDGPGQGAATLGYAILNATGDMDPGTQANEISRALNAWAAVVTIQFVPVGGGAPGSIDLSFGPTDHGDAYPFGAGVLAHAFWPGDSWAESQAGDVHFNDDVQWGGGGYDLFTIAMHEVGHALGVGHSTNPNDVMYASYTHPFGNLSPGDSGTVRTLYAGFGGYLGCYSDGEPRGLPQFAGSSSAMSPNVCKSMCAGWAYAGAQNGNECWCGNAIAHQRVVDGECSSTCSGNSTGRCGGPWRNSIFATGSTTPPPPPPPPPPSGVRFFSDIYNNGGSFAASGDLGFVGWDWNDQISSIDNPGSRTIVLYEHDQFNGQSLTITGNAPDLRWYPGPGADGTWNDAASSLRVY